MARTSGLADKATYRAWAENDVRFVYDAWLNSWRTSKFAGVIANHLFYTTTRTTIDELIARGAQVVVAEYNGELLGFSCGEVKDGKTVLHYCYVKDCFLGHGLEEALPAKLLGTKPGWFTFAQNRFLKDRQWKHAPEMARRQKL